MSLKLDYNNTALLTTQIERYALSRQEFVAHFGPGPVSMFRTPGRVNLIGEHTDYNDGFVMPVALDKDVLFIVRPRADRTINVTNIENNFTPV
ncbi:MAG: galactokinase family protein, partial [Planctomycetes bacterium]|nr:galactokinase family protein [Planctomycetota bacterium]